MSANLSISVTLLDACIEQVRNICENSDEKLLSINEEENFFAYEHNIDPVFSQKESERQKSYQKNLQLMKECKKMQTAFHSKGLLAYRRPGIDAVEETVQ